jgi:hypothetical protein
LQAENIVRAGVGGEQAFIKGMLSSGLRAAFPKAVNLEGRLTNLGISLNFTDDGVRLVSNQGIELGTIVKSGEEEILLFSDDLISSSHPTNVEKALDDLQYVEATSGEVMNNIGIVKNADGSISYIENAYEHANALVKTALNNRRLLKEELVGILITEEAHHLIPFKLLQENAVVQKAVEGGFQFNKAINGIALEKYVAKTGLGRHAKHDFYTKQIEEYLKGWARDKNYIYTAAEAKQVVEALTTTLRNKITTTTGRINLLNLAL